MAEQASHTVAPEEAGRIERILDEKGRSAVDVIGVLQAIQSEFHYLPAHLLRYVCAHSDITPAAITGVATFYTQFRHRPAGAHMVNVCIGTACHVKGATRIIDAFRRRLNIEEGSDTDPDGQFTVQGVNCLGCCTLAPAVQIGGVIYGYATTENVGDLLEDYLRRASGSPRTAQDGIPAGTPRGAIRVGMGSCCVASGAADIEVALRAQVAQTGAPARVERVSCAGLCYEEPVVEVVSADRPPQLYTQVKPHQVPAILHENFPPPRRRTRFGWAARSWLERLYTDEARLGPRRFEANTRDPQIASYLDPQVHIATEGHGRLDPLSIEAYTREGGFEALRKVRAELTPEETIDGINHSGLRGRGGGGYPTGLKWREVARVTGQRKFVICNGDEGDPGAFMDRMLLESYPFRVIEGMAIAGHAVGAAEGVFYIRNEYPLAIERIREAIEIARAAGWLAGGGADPESAFNLRIMEGAGAFVCGEETALIASIEGRRGMPRLRPPFPATSGLHGCPTLVNNTETLALVPWIMRNGPEAFAAIGTEKSKGTKVFALAGKIRRGGLIEVPMGMTIRRVIEEVGGGIEGGRQLKAVQIGGPSGGCIPAALADTPIDYEALVDAGAMMGSGGLVALDEADCMVEIARYFLAFTQHESCGKCTFCRVGTKRMLEMLERLCDGRGHTCDLDELERLAGWITRGSLCGLGRTAPNPAMTTLRYFREEYEAHTRGFCPAGQCKALIRYEINEECIGCTRCAQVCPADAILPKPYEKHFVDPDVCVRCDACLQACPAAAVTVTSGGRVVRQASVSKSEAEGTSRP